MPEVSEGDVVVAPTTRPANAWRKPVSEWDRRPPAEKRVAIRKAAARLLAERGLDGMTIHALAQEAGMHFAAVRALFPSKFDLVEDIASTHLGRFYADLDAAGLDGLPGRERLGVMARLLARVAHAHPDAHAVLMMGLASLPLPGRNALRARVAWLFGGVAEAVALRLPRLPRPATEERAWQLLLLLAAPPLWAAEWDERAVDAAANAAVERVVGGRASRLAG